MVDIMSASYSIDSKADAKRCVFAFISMVTDLVRSDHPELNREKKMTVPTYRGATPMLNGAAVEIAYETCDGFGTPRYKIRGSDKWYSGGFAMRGYDHQIELTEIK